MKATVADLITEFFPIAGLGMQLIETIGEEIAMKPVELTDDQFAAVAAARESAMAGARAADSLRA